MSAYLAVTTWPPGAAYAPEWLETFLEHWPGTLLVYLEEDDPRVPDDRRVMCKRFDEIGELPGGVVASDWLATAREVGEEARKPKIAENLRVNVQWPPHVAQFAHKVFAMYDAVHIESAWRESDLCAYRKVFFVDADCVALKPIPGDVLDGLFEGGRPICAMLREPRLWTETGFVGFDQERFEVEIFLRVLVDIYVQNIIWGLPQYHDCAAFDFALAQTQLPVANMVSDLSDLHVLPRTVMGEYIDHRKGKRRKKLGYSPERFTCPELSPSSEHGVAGPA